MGIDEAMIEQDEDTPVLSRSWEIKKWLEAGEVVDACEDNIDKLNSRPAHDDPRTTSPALEGGTKTRDFTRKSLIFNIISRLLPPSTLKKEEK
jgi:hypothetical protein